MPPCLKQEKTKTEVMPLTTLWLVLQTHPTVLSSAGDYLEFLSYGFEDHRFLSGAISRCLSVTGDVVGLRQLASS